MSNNFVVNSAGLNSSGTMVVAASIAAALFITSGDASSYTIASGSSSGVIATEGIAQGGQIHAGSASGELVSGGTTSSIRITSYVPKTDYSNITGTSLSGFTYAYGGSAVDLGLSGETYPNYFIEGSATNSGEISLKTSVPVDSWRIKFSSTQRGVMGLSGHFVTPRVVTITDLFVLTGLNGYCIPANELGYGHAELGTVVTCDAVRLVKGEAHVTLWGEGPVLYTNNSPYYQGGGILETTGLVNIAIYLDHTKYWTHYYEDWLTLNIGDMQVEPKVFKNAIADTGSLAVTVETEPVKMARAQINQVLVQIVGSFDTEKRSGMITELGYTGLSGRTSAKIKKTVTPIGTLGTYVSSANTVVYKQAEALGDITTVGVTQSNTIISGVMVNGVIGSSISTSAVRFARPITVNGLPTTGSINSVVFKRIKEVGTVALTGGANYRIGVKVQNGTITASGFTIGRKVQLGTSAGTVGLVAVAADTRLAVRPELVAGWETLVDSGNDYRLAVRLEFNEELTTSGALFDVVNLFGRADETRQMTVAPSSARDGNYHNYMKVVA